MTKCALLGWKRKCVGEVGGQQKCGGYGQRGLCGKNVGVTPEQCAYARQASKGVRVSGAGIDLVACMLHSTACQGWHRDI